MRRSLLTVCSVEKRFQPCVRHCCAALLHRQVPAIDAAAARYDESVVFCRQPASRLLLLPMPSRRACYLATRNTHQHRLSDRLEAPRLLSPCRPNLIPEGASRKCALRLLPLVRWRWPAFFLTCSLGLLLWQILLEAGGGSWCGCTRRGKRVCLLRHRALWR